MGRNFITSKPTKVSRPTSPTHWVRIVGPMSLNVDDDSDTEHVRLFLIRRKNVGVNLSMYSRIEWPISLPFSSFILLIRDQFNIVDESSFVLEDEDGCVIALSPMIPPGKYNLIETDSCESISRIINKQSEVNSGLDGSNNIVQEKEVSLRNRKYKKSNVYKENDDIESSKPLLGGESKTEKPSKGFEMDLLRTTCADTLIANERTWLAWTRTSLNIMTCCFTFVFLDSWSTTSLFTKVLSNMCLIAFSIAFFGCFVVGYVRYKMFVKLCRSSPFSSRLNELSEIDDKNVLTIWTYFLGFVLAFSGIVFIGVLNRSAESNIIDAT